MPREICLHFHIFKNAGMTVDWALRRNFGKRFALHDGPTPDYVLGAEEVNEFLHQHSKVAAVSSHQVQLTDEFDKAFRTHRLVFVRHPIDRVGSVYSFNRRRKDVTPGALRAKELSFPDYVRSNLRHPHRSSIGDFQVRCCSGKRTKQFHDTALTHQDVAISTSRLSKCAVAGVVERLDESLVVAETSLAPFFPGIDLSYEKQNVSSDRARDFSSRLDLIHSALGGDLMARLMDRNQLDIALHEAANEMLTQQTRAIPGFDMRLYEFRKRCRRFRRAA